MAYTLMIVDDEEDICSNYLAFFEDYSEFRATAHSSGEEALAALGELGCPDACIVDIRLLGMRGDAFIVEARKRCPDCRFVVSTGSLDASLSPEFRAAGLAEEDIFYKPADMMKILSRIQQLLE